MGNIPRYPPKKTVDVSRPFAPLPVNQTARELPGGLMVRTVFHINKWHDNNPGKEMGLADLVQTIQANMSADDLRVLSGEQEGVLEFPNTENTNFARAHNDRQHTHFSSRLGMSGNSLKEVIEGVKGWVKENPLDAGALAVSPVPVVGDIAGFANDARHFIYEPESRTVGNMALGLAGLIPFVPPMAGVIQSTVRKIPQVNLAQALKQPDDVVVDFGTLSSSKFRQLNKSLKEVGEELLENRDVKIPVNVLKKLKRERNIKDGITADELADVIFSAVHGKKSKVTGSKHPHIKTLINTRQRKSNVALIAKDPNSGDTVLKSGYPRHTSGLKKLVRKKP